jgi:hypothetical protein
MLNPYKFENVILWDDIVLDLMVNKNEFHKTVKMKVLGNETEGNISILINLYD